MDRRGHHQRITDRAVLIWSKERSCSSNQVLPVANDGLHEGSVVVVVQHSFDWPNRQTFGHLSHV